MYCFPQVVGDSTCCHPPPTSGASGASALESRRFVEHEEFTEFAYAFICSLEAGTEASGGWWLKTNSNMILGDLWRIFMEDLFWMIFMDDFYDLIYLWLWWCKAAEAWPSYQRSNWAVKVMMVEFSDIFWSKSWENHVLDFWWFLWFFGGAIFNIFQPHPQRCCLTPVEHSLKHDFLQNMASIQGQHGRRWRHNSVPEAVSLDVEKV